MNLEKITEKRKASEEKPWLQFYPEALRNFVPSEDTLTDFILKHNPDHDRAVIEFYGKIFTFNEVLAERDKVAKSLVSLGVKENDKLVVILRAVPEFIFVLLAAEKVGAAIVCHDGEPEERAAAIRDAKAKIVFSNDFITKEDEELYFKDTDLETLVLVSPYTYGIREEMPDYVSAAVEKLYCESSPSDERTYVWNDFLKKGESLEGETYPEKNPDRHLYCSYTSGSTGPSKQVIHSARSMNGVLGQLVIPGGIGFSMKVLHTLILPLNFPSIFSISLWVITLYSVLSVKQRILILNL